MSLLRNVSAGSWDQFRHSHMVGNSDATFTKLQNSRNACTLFQKTELWSSVKSTLAACCVGKCELNNNGKDGMNWISMKLLKVISWYFLRYEWEMPSLSLFDRVQFLIHQRPPFYQYGLTLTPAWLSNYIHYNVWYEITYPFLNLNGATVEV